MIPTNYNQKHGCVVISSACVLWQGGLIPCIEICNGDTVQDVITKLGEKICEINEMLNPQTYNLSCFNFGNCPPDNFHDLLQFILDAICLLNTQHGISTGEGQTLGQQIPLLNCLQFVDSFGNTVTQLPIYTPSHEDYLTLLGNKICEIIESYGNLQNRMAQVTERMKLLETTLANNQIIVPSINLLSGFDDITGGSNIIIWGHLLVRLQQYTNAISGIYDGLNTGPFAQRFSPNSFNNLYEGFSGNRNRLCSSAQLSLSDNKNIIKALENLWTYIHDIRGFLNTQTCGKCEKCKGMANIKLTYEFLGPELVRFTLWLPQGYTISNHKIYYSVFTNNISIESLYGEIEETMFNVQHRNLIFRKEWFIHVKGCLTYTSTGTICDYEFVMPFYNPFYGCFKYQNISHNITNIQIITL